MPVAYRCVVGTSCVKILAIVDAGEGRSMRMGIINQFAPDARRSTTSAITAM